MLLNQVIKPDQNYFGQKDSFFEESLERKQNQTINISNQRKDGGF